MSDDVPLDDVLAMARTAGHVLARREAERAYRRLMLRIRRAASKPFIFGIPMSIRIRWGFRDSARFTACAPS